MFLLTYLLIDLLTYLLVLFPSPSSAFLTTHALLVSLSLLYLLLLAYFQAGHVSAKTDAFALGVVLLELLTGLPPAAGEDGEGEALASQMLSIVDRAQQLLPPWLDKAAGQWPVAAGVKLGRIARVLLDQNSRTRCDVSRVLNDLDALAGREPVARAGRGERYNESTGKLEVTTRAKNIAGRKAAARAARKAAVVAAAPPPLPSRSAEGGRGSSGERQGAGAAAAPPPQTTFVAPQAVGGCPPGGTGRHAPGAQQSQAGGQGAASGSYMVRTLHGEPPGGR